MENTFEKNIVEFIKFVQFERSIASVELARITGLTIDVLWNICNYRTKISEAIRQKIFEGLGVTFDEFIDFVTINNLKIQIKGEF
ncbi:MAG TPA: helix-turn-helix transcriptional regulator [Desulfosporosinus sp.]|nr:helix-turn-helix transcriptional regulator [Desulfosporosinus sp.]